MSNRKQVHEITPEGKYAIGHFLGDSYSGPSGGFLFWDGVIPVPVVGALCLKNSLPNVGVFFEHIEGHELRWDGAEWMYEAAVIPEPPAKPEKPKPKRKKRAVKPRDSEAKPRKKRGRPKGSKNKAK